MTAAVRCEALTSGQLVPKLRVWGAPQQADFFTIYARRKFEKIASVMTLALLAVLHNGSKVPK